MGNEKNRLWVLVSFTIVCLAIVCGCKGKKDLPEKDQSINNMHPSETGFLELAVAFWEKGEKEKAIDQLLKIVDTQKEPWSNTCVLSLTTKELGDLSVNQRKQKQDEIIEYTKTVKMLCRYAVTTAEDYIKQNDYDSAEQLLTAILKIGTLLAKPDKITKLDGLAIKKLASQYIEEIHKKSGDHTD